MNLGITPEEFFRERLVSAMDHQKLQVSKDVEWYLVQLMCGFVKPEKQNRVEDNAQDGEGLFTETPLALLLKKALEAAPGEKLRVYKEIGDTSLYLSGYFQDSFANKIFSLDYVMDMGSQAYRSASNIIRLKEKHFSSLYAELSERFSRLVEVMAEVSDGIHLGNEKERDASPKHLIFLYERWINTGSHRIQRRLQKQGLSVERGHHGSSNSGDEKASKKWCQGRPH